MGYLRAWKHNLAALVVLLAGIAAVVGVIAWASGKQFKSGAGLNATHFRVSVTGSAPTGMYVRYVDQTGLYPLKRSVKPPFHAAGPLDGSEGKVGMRDVFVEFDATPRGDANIACTVRIGTAVDVEHATGLNTCSATLTYDEHTGTWHH